MAGDTLPANSSYPADAAVLSNANLTTPLSTLRGYLQSVMDGTTGYGLNGVYFKQDTANSTIASGVISVSGKTDHVLVDTEASAASDDLDTINGGTNSGRILFLRMVNSGRVVTVRHNTGNIRLWGGANVTLASDKNLALMWNGTYWSDLFIPQTVPSTSMARLTARTTLGTSSSLTISSISQSYQDLLLVLELRSSTAAQTDVVRMQFGSGSLDTTASNYFSYDVIHFGATPTHTVTANDAANAQIRWNGLGANATASHAAFAWVYIRNYSRSAEMKEVTILNGGNWASSGSTWIGQTTGLWKNTSSVIDQIKLDWNSGANFASPSSYSVWGISA